MTFKQQLIMIGSVLSLCSMLLAIGAVYLFAHGAKWGGAGMGLLAFCSLLVGFLFLASEDPDEAPKHLSSSHLDMEDEFA